VLQLPRTSSTDWPYLNNRIQSATKLEVGFDVAADKALNPATTYDWMSYCTPRWISPFTYVHEMTEALNGAANAPAVLAKAAAAVGPFWTVSGTITGGTATLDPVFVRDVEGPTATGSGNYSIVVKDGGGGVLYTRLFTPSEPHTESTGPEVSGLLTYFELIPVQAGAAQIVVPLRAASRSPRQRRRGAGRVVCVAGCRRDSERTAEHPVDDHRPGQQHVRQRTRVFRRRRPELLSLGQTAQSLPRVDFDQLPGRTVTPALRTARTRAVVSPRCRAVACADGGHPRQRAVVFPAGRRRLAARQRARPRRWVLDGSAVQWLSSRDVRRRVVACLH
jgi:hypothetical protein